MAELTLEAAQKLVASVDKNGRARDEKGRFIAQEQVKIAKELIQQNKKIPESNKSGFQSVIDATKEANNDFQEIKTLQSALKDEQSSTTKAQKTLVKLQLVSESERKSDHDLQIKKQEKIIEEAQKTSFNITAQIAVTKDQLSPLQKENLALQGRKESLEEMAEGLKSMGLNAEEDKDFRKEQQAIQLAEINLRMKGEIPLSKRLELEKEKAALQAKSDSILQKGFGSLKLGLLGLGEKFGKGAMSIGKTLLTLFGLGLLIKFLKSDTWKNIREFLTSPGWETFRNIFPKEGFLARLVDSPVWGNIRDFLTTGSWEDFKKIFTDEDGSINGIVVALTLGLAAITALITLKLAAALATITGLTLLAKVGKKVFGGKGAATGASKVATKPAKAPRRLPDGTRNPAHPSELKKKGFEVNKSIKKPGFFSRTLGAAKKLGGAALEKGAKVGKQVAASATKTFGAAKKLGGAALEKGAKVGKQVAASATKIGKDAIVSGKAVLPKIAGASKTGLALAAKGAKFIPGVGLVLTAAVAAVEGVAAGVEEFKENGDAGRAIAEGLGGVVSSLSFGLADKDKVADFLQNKQTPSPNQPEFQIGDSNALRLKTLEKQLQTSEGATDPRSKALRESRLDEMKSLEAKTARKSSAGATVTTIAQDNSTKMNSHTNRLTNIAVLDPATLSVQVANV